MNAVRRKTADRPADSTPRRARDALILRGPDREGAGHDKQNRCNGE